MTAAALPNATLIIELVHNGRWANRFVWSLVGQSVRHDHTAKEMATSVVGAKADEFDLTEEPEQERQLVVAA